MNLKELLLSPPAQYRPIPFWSLNDTLLAEEMKWQIGQMAEAGLGGYFLHARSGLKTEYLSQQWMDLVRCCIDEGKKYGLSTWLYDENGYPSGFGNGAVPAMGVAYHAKWVIFEEASYAEVTERTLGYYLINGDGCIPVKSTAEFDAIPDGAKLLHFLWDSDPYYVDVLDRNVIRTFIDVAYEPYKYAFGDEFGKAVKGIFTDEPQYIGKTIPWSLVLPQEFLAEHGYDLIPKLPLLFFDFAGYERLRHDYWQTVNRLFTFSYSAQIGCWCEENAISFTGHINEEEALAKQMRNDAGAMPFYRHMQMPGVDWLGRMIGTPVTVKQVASVAHQFHKERVLCETYGGCGWNVSFEELKWIAEWLYVLGVNTMCQHLQLYSMRGSRKNDYPPSLFYQQPWWKQYRGFNDYLARLGILLTQGEYLCGTLVIHPIRSAWVRYKYNATDRGLGKLDTDFEDISRWLLELHVDYDYGDEGDLAENAHLEDGTLVLGQARYHTVLLTCCEFLEKTTIELLNAFVCLGGAVLCVGEFPQNCFDEDCAGALQTLKHRVTIFPMEKERLRESLCSILQDKISIADETGGEASTIYIQHRRLEDGDTLIFAVNTSRETTICARITIQGNWVCKECLLEDGRIVDYCSESSDCKTRLCADFLPMQSHLFLLTLNVSDEKSEPPDIVIDSIGKNEPEITLNGQWELELDDYNALLLDYARVCVDGREWSTKLPLYRIMESLLKLKKPVQASLLFSFDFHMDPKQCRDLFLGIEDPGQYKIRINNIDITEAPLGWWRDKSIKIIPIRECVVQGENEIRLDLLFECSEQTYYLTNLPEIHSTLFNKLTIDMEVSQLYILGDFGVYSASGYTHGDYYADFTEGPFYIDSLPETVHTGDLVPQGLCFYSGNAVLRKKLALEQSFARASLDMEKKPHSVLYKAFVNGQLKDTRMWAPYFSALGSLEAGVTEIGILLFGSNRNLLGPHHHIEGEIMATGPSSFTDKKGWVERNLTVDNIWTDRYCFVQFGLQQTPKLKLADEYR